MKIHMASNLASAVVVRELCGVESRAELDHNERAAALFHERIRGPYAKYLVSIGAVE